MKGVAWNRITVFVFMLITSLAAAQSVATPAKAEAQTAVPELVNFNGVLTDAIGKPISSLTGVTFLLYKDQQGGAPLWLETQNVQPDRSGHYVVTLGSTKRDGLPADLFVSGEARWLAVQVAGEPEQPRVLLVAVPYAMKAKDAETVGGLPPSAFVLASPTNGGVTTPSSGVSPAASVAPLTTSSVTTSGGTANSFPIFTTGTNIQNSIMTQTGTTAVNVAGKLNHPSIGPATSTGGKNSQPAAWVASSFNSGTVAAVNQTFQLQAEPVGNNTTAPSGTLNLLFASGGSTPAETGLKINNKGILSFASGQTFPGTGSVTSVGLAAPASDFKVTGSPVSKSGTLNLAWAVAPTNANTANAIVKRDSTGSFNTTNITASGQITVNNGSSLNPIISTATAANAAAIVGSSTGSGLTDGVLGASFSSGQGSAGVIGIDQNSSGVSGNYTTGVTGVTTSAFGLGVLGYGTLSNNLKQNIGFSRTGVWGDDASGTGVVASSDSGSALNAFNTSTTPTVTAVNNSTGRAVFAFNSSTTDQTMYVQNNTTQPTGVIFRAEAPQVQVNGSTAFCEVNTRGGLGCTGDVAQNLPANGLVKALIFFDPSQPVGSQIVHCFNSTLREPAASTPPCGFTNTHLNIGINQIDFGFPVNGRFPQVTAVLTTSDTNLVAASVDNFGAGTANQLSVHTFYAVLGTETDTPFYLTIF